MRWRGGAPAARLERQTDSVTSIGALPRFANDSSSETVSLALAVIAAGFDRWDDQREARTGATASTTGRIPPPEPVTDVFAGADDDVDLDEDDDDFDVPSFLK
jgi:hypothetical protein